ncbi:hypothetical protein M501DRAFT_1017132 [Patellaria atrata CBS 101060]|uniref:F-box domain-containing protein n=1 Tax=Patellaria atrata CBS 101060 TaxID=1346257 RepID=A0A9P4S8S7_9PEZI|nr:hypothetical protein M501DRAFT_1017132 [Patellaria atrata CBS 101060]
MDTLPTELLEIIFGFLEVDLSKTVAVNQERMTALSSISRTSKWFNVMASKVLYASIDVSECNNLFDLLKTTRSRPELAARITSLRVDGVKGRRPFRIDDESLLAQELTQLTSIRSPKGRIQSFGNWELAIHFQDREALLALLITKLPNIAHLHFKSIKMFEFLFNLIEIGVTSVQSQFSRFDRLGILCIDGAWDCRKMTTLFVPPGVQTLRLKEIRNLCFEPSKELQASGYHLKHLVLDGCRVSARELKNFFFQNSQIEKIEARNMVFRRTETLQPPPAFFLDHSVSFHLRDLDLREKYNPNKEQTGLQVVFLARFKDCPRLSTISFSMTGNSGLRDPLDGQHVFPRSLENLNIEVVTLGPPSNSEKCKVLLKALDNVANARDAGNLPSLRHITLILPKAILHEDVRGNEVRMKCLPWTLPSVWMSRLQDSGIKVTHELISLPPPRFPLPLPPSGFSFPGEKRYVMLR